MFVQTPTPSVFMVLVQALLGVLIFALLAGRRSRLRGWRALLFLSILFYFYTISPIGRSQLESNPFDGIRLLRVAAMALVLAISSIAIVSQRRGITVAPPLQTYLLFVGLAIVSSAYSASAGLTIFKAVELGAGLVLAVAVSAHVRDSNDVKAVIDVFLAAFLFLIATALVNIAVYPELALRWTRSDVMPFRLRGVWPLINTNELAQMATIVGGVGLLRFLAKGRHASRAAYLVVVASCAGVLILTGSRTSILTFAILLLYVAILRRSVFLIGLMIAGIVLTASYGMQQIIVAYVLRGESAESITMLGGRMAIWPVFIDLFKESPLFGHGYYAAHRLIDESVLISHGLDNAEVVSTTDNTHIEILLGLGLAGLALSVTFLVQTWRAMTKARQLLRATDAPRPAAMDRLIELKLILIVILVRSLTGPTYQVHSYNSLLLAFVMVCAATLLGRAMSATREPAPRGRPRA